LQIPGYAFATRLDQDAKNYAAGITREKTEQLIDRIRNKIPGIALRTTLIAGHPGETEDDFHKMLDFVEKTRFDRLGIFT